MIGGIGLVESIVSGETENLAEDVAGLVGAVVGGALGGAAGSVAGPIGTAVGGTAGAIAGDALARELVDDFGEFADRFESATPASDVHPLAARRQALLAAPVNLEPAPVGGGAPPQVKSRGNMRYQSRVGPIIVQSPSADPKQVAIEVADEIERRQREQRERLDNDVSADGSSEIVY